MYRTGGSCVDCEMGQREHLTPQQLEGARFLAARRVAGLWDRAGYGKTAQYVRACDIIGASRITVVCPKVLRKKEVAEFEKWSLFGYRPTIIDSGDADVPKGDGLVVVNYDLVRQPKIKQKLMDRGCDALILDEAHRTKAPGRTTLAMFGLRGGGLVKTAARIWHVTGTPAPKDAGDMYVFAKVAGAWAGTYDEFTRRFCIVVNGQFGPVVLGTKEETLPELLALLRPYALQRYEVDTARPPLARDEIEVDGALPKYTETDTATLRNLIRAAEAGDWSLLDNPFMATARRRVGLAKAGAIAELAATELDSGHVKLLIFCEHTAVIDEIAGRLSAYGVGIIDGRTSEREMESIVHAFSGAGPVLPRVAIIQRMALKEGRDLIAARRVLLAEPAWTPDDNEQMIARSWRRGQTNNVHASYCWLPGSIDDAVRRVVARREKDGSRLRIT